MTEDYLSHHGIKGQKWGIRRFQNADGNLTTAGRNRKYNKKNMQNADTQHLDKWGTDKNHNILYISGKSGSGKSTAASAMSDSNTNVIHLDSYFEKKNKSEANKDKNERFNNFLKKNGFDINSLNDEKLFKNNVKEDFQTVILITIVCSNDENAMTILHGLEGCVKWSFFDELTRKKANAVDTEAIKIALNSVYGKGAFNTDTYDILLQIENLCEEPEKEIDSVEADINYIADNLESDDLFLQMAEEAAELSQACLKYVRAHKGNNPTKDSEDVYLKGIIEEFTDVQVCAEAIDITADSDIRDSKIHRWADRIRKKNGGSAK